MRVIGTAGHVDHGKSTLIAALTGIHPDRLKEEQEREMTIDLGFGWLTLPDGQEVGIVDVPGHRDFIENMLSGVGGIDAALLVIAADEGVMPQTSEHLAILDLLQIPAGLIALNKIDLIDDPEWLDLIESDIRAAVAGTILQDAPLVRVSARSGSGLDQLLSTLTDILRTRPSRPDLGRPRLPIDRVFSLPGFGTIVTGTLSDGQLSIGQEVVVLPSGAHGRIRGLQTHKKKEETAQPGSRTAVNISGLAVEDIRRGEVLALPGQYRPTRRIDVHLRLLDDIQLPLKHASEVKLFIGASETLAKVRLLGTDELAPGQEGWLQLDLHEPIVTVRGDRYILRRPSPAETLGGGAVVDPQPKGRHKRADQDVIRSLEALALGSPSEVLMEASLALGPASIKEIVARSHLDQSAAQTALDELFASGQLVRLDGEQLVLATSQWQALKDNVAKILSSYHQKYPLRSGIPREELKSRLKIAPRLFQALLKRLAEENALREQGETVSSPGHEIRLDDSQQAKVRALMRRFEQAPFAPPSFKDCQTEVGEELVNVLIERGELVAVSPEVVFRKADFDTMVARVRNEMQSKGQLTVSEVRDLFGSSRKYTLAFLEYLDSRSITVRNGDYRKFKK